MPQKMHWGTPATERLAGAKPSTRKMDWGDIINESENFNDFRNLTKSNDKVIVAMNTRKTKADWQRMFERKTGSMSIVGENKRNKTRICA